MAIPFLNHLDLRSVSELQNAILHKTTTATASNVEGKFLYDTGTNSLQYYNGSTWINLDGSGDISEVVAGTYLNGGGTSGAVTLNHDATSRTDTTSTDNPAFGGTFQAVQSVTTNATGHVTSIDVSTVTLQTPEFFVSADSGTNQTVEQSDTLTISGGTNISTVVGATDTVTVNLDDSVTLAGTLTVNGTGQSSFAGQVTIPILPVASTDAASKDYVDNAVVGGLVYQGGYNAATNTPDLTTSPNSILKGWTYTVTADGTFFGEQLRVGDVLIAEVNDPSALTDWTTVQNNIDLASLTQVGIGNVAAGTGISVSYSNGTATVTNTQTNSNNTFAATITDTATVTHNLGTKDVIIQLYDVTTDETVYADVERASTNTATITFATTPTNSIRVLVQKIG